MRTNVTIHLIAGIWYCIGIMWILVEYFFKGNINMVAVWITGLGILMLIFNLIHVAIKK